MKFLSDILAKAGLIVDGTVTLNNVANTSTSTGKFVVIDANVVKYRTAAQVLSEIGAQPVGSYLTSESDTLATVTARGAVTTGDIAVNGKLSIGTQYAGLGQYITANSGTGTFDFVNASGSGYSYRFIQNGATAVTISTGNNLLVGTTTDSGSYKADIYGAVRVGISGNTGNTYFTNEGRTYSKGMITTDSDLTFTGYSTRYVFANSLLFTTNNGLSNASAARYTITQQAPTANSGTGTVDLLYLLHAVNTGTSVSNSRALVIDFSVTSNAGTLTAIEAVQGKIKFGDLAGTGNRMVIADSTGTLSTQSIPTGTVTGTGTANYHPKWSSSTGLTTSILYDDGSALGVGTASPASNTLFNIVANSTRTKAIRLDSSWSYQTSWNMVNGVYVAEFNLGGSTKATAEGGPGSFQISLYNGSTSTFKYPITAFATGNIAVTNTSTIPTDSGQALQVTGAIRQTSVTSSLIRVDSTGVIVAATAGTDYQAPITLTTTGSSGAATFSSNTLNIPNYTLSGLGGQPSSANLTSLSGLSYASTSFVKMTAAGTFSLDTNNYVQFAISNNLASGLNGALPSAALWSFDGYGGSVPNSPDNSWHELLIHVGSASRGLQIAGGYDNNNLYFRKGNTTWQSWIQLASTSYVDTAVANLVASAPAALDTLNELAAALGNDASFSTTVSTALGNRLRVDINTQGLTTTQKSNGRTNLGVVIGSDVQAWDADLDAIAALSGTSGFLKKTAANTWALDTNTYLTSYTDTLATVTSRGATTSTVVTFSGGDGNNSSVKLSGYNQRGGAGYHGFLEVTTTFGTATNPNKYFRLDSVGSLQIINSAYTASIFSLTDAGALSVPSSLTAGSIIKSGGTSSQFLKADGSVDSSVYITGITSSMVTTALGYTPVPTTRTLTINGTAYDLSADRSWTITAGVSSVNAGTGVSVNSTTGAVTVSIGQSVATTAQVTFDSVIATNNGLGTNYKVGDDAWIGDINLANTIRITGVQDGTQGYIVFGNSNGTALGRSGTGALTYGGNTVYHAGNLTNLNQLSNGPGYITGNQTITLSGDASGSGTTAITVTLANSGVTAGTYNNVTVDAKGRVTSATNVSYQSPLTNPITGTGTTGTLPKFSSSTGLTDSIIREISSSRLLIGTGTVDDTLSTIQTNGFIKAVGLTLDGAVGANTNLWIKSITGYIGQIIYMNNSNMTFALRDNGTNWDVYSYVSGNTGQKFIVYASGTVKLPGYTSNGFLKTSASDGTLIVDTNSYLTGNQTITLSGDATGSGTTSIAVTLANSGVTAGTYTKVTVDAKGRVTSGTTLSAADVPTLNQNTTGSAGSLSSNGDYFVFRGNGVGSSIDTYTDNGFRTLSYTGYSSQLWSANSGGSTGTVQFELEYNTPVRGFKVRNKTDNTSWSATGWVVMTTTNQGHISGTLATQSWVTSQGYITSYSETDTLASVTARGATTSTAVTLSSTSNYYSGHHYFNPYDADGNHYPHYLVGGNNNGAKVNIRVFTGNGTSLKLFHLNGQTGAITWDGYTVWHSGNLTNLNQLSNGPGYITSSALSSYLPLAGGTMTGSLNITGGLGGNNTSGYTAATRIVFNNDYNDSPRGPNKITLYDSSWLGGFGVHNNTLAYYSGGTHKWYQATTASNAVQVMQLDSSGNVTIAGTLTEQSALRYKENIAPVTAALDKVDQLKPVSYNKKGSATKEIGLIAEDVFDIYPEFVLCDDNGEPVGIHYSRLTAVLIESVKELKKEINELKNRN